MKTPFRVSTRNDNTACGLLAARSVSRMPFGPGRFTAMSESDVTAP